MSRKRSEYEYQGKRIRKITKVCNRLIKIIPELRYINKDDFMIVIANEKTRKSSITGRYTIATMGTIPNNLWTFLLGKTLPPSGGLRKKLPKFLMTIYPVFFSRRRVHVNRTKDLTHELYHIAPSKKGIRDHVGFGDEPIDLMVETNRKKLEELDI